LKYSTKKYIAPSIKKSVIINTEQKKKTPVKRVMLKSNKLLKPPIEPKVKEKKNTWLTGEGREKWKKDWKEKVIENELFTKKMREIQRGIELRKEAEYEKLLKRIEIDQRVEKPQEVVDLLEEFKTRREQEKLDKAELRRQERERLLQFINNGAKRYEDVKSKVNMPQLERAKRELADKRNIYIERKEVYDIGHEKRFDKITMKYSNDKDILDSNQDELFPELPLKDQVIYMN